MERAPDSTGDPGREKCSRPELAALLPRLGELELLQRRSLEEHAARCPECGPSLALLSRADAWLQSRAPAPAGECPPADVLYDFGGGPGATPLPPARRAEVEAHLADCRDCETLVGTLAVHPPSPLVLDPVEAAPATAPVGHRGPRGRLRALGPVLAAAAVVLAMFLVFRESNAGDAGPIAYRYPEGPLLRGPADGDLLFPRDRLLATSRGTLWSELVFELAPRERAASYVVYLTRTQGGAFEAGARIAELESGTPEVAAGPGVEALIVPGHYTWEAWAVVDGLDVPLGRRDFEVVVDDELLDQLEELQGRPEPERSERMLTLLQGRYPADARAHARTLPPSEGREAYLGRSRR
jgi:hypothetical protein